MNTTHVSTEYISQQIKVFSKWVSFNLTNSKSSTKITDVTKDLKNSAALVELSEALIGKSAPQSLNLSSKKADDIVHYYDLAIDMFTKDGVHLKGISGKEVNESKEKFILGLVWTLILHYSIDKSIRFNNDVNKVNDKTKFSSKSKVTHYISEKHYKQALMQWAFDCTENYPGINEFQPFGLSICALLDFYFPDKINFYSLDPSDTETNSKIAIQIMKNLNIPLLFDLTDFQSKKIDDKALLTQLAVIKIGN